MATYVLLVTLLLVTLLLGAAILHYRRKSLTNEKALHTRSGGNIIVCLISKWLLKLFLEITTAGWQT